MSIFMCLTASLAGAACLLLLSFFFNEGFREGIIASMTTGKFLVITVAVFAICGGICSAIGGGSYLFFGTVGAAILARKSLFDFAA